MTTVGRGVLVLRADRDGVAEDRLLPFVVSDHGIAFHDLSAGPEPRPLIEVAPELLDAGEVGAGHVSLACLPATPADAFDGITVRVTDGGVTMRVVHQAPFGAQGGHRFSALDLVLTDPGDGQPLEVDPNASVTVDFGAGPVVLGAVVDEDGRLRFRIAQSEEITLPADSSLTLTTLDVGVDRDDPWDGLLALYTFDEEPDPQAAVVFADTSLVVDGTGNHDPVDVTGLVARPGPDRPRGVAIGGGDGLRSQGVAVKLSAMGGKNNPYRTDALTIEAWIVNHRQTTIGKPARIVSLSKGDSLRNFTLGLDWQDSRREAVFYEGRLRTRTSYDGTPGIISTRPQVTNRPTMVVMTRGQTTPTSERAGRVYVDGIDATEPGTATGDRRGGFDDWKEYRLSLGNEDDAPRLWNGELYRVAIYNRELSGDEIRERHQANVRREGHLVLGGLPAPFDRVFPVSIETTDDGLETAVDPSIGPLQIAPGFTVDKIVLVWPSGSADEGPIGGSAVASLWGEEFEVDVALSGSRLELTARSLGQREIDLDRGQGTEHFGHVRLRSLTIAADRSPSPSWELDTEGDLRIHGFASPLHEALPLEIFLHADQVWAGARPDADAMPLNLFDAVALTAFDLRYRPSGTEGWLVEADTDRLDRHGVALRLFGRSLPLTPTFVESGRGPGIALAWSIESGSGTGRPPVGRLVPVGVRFEPNPSWQTSEPIWSVALETTLALGDVSSAERDVERLDVRLLDAELQRDRRSTPQLLTLRGGVVVSHGDHELWRGSWAGAGVGYVLDGGRFKLLPDWSTVLVEAEATIEVAANGTVMSRPRAATAGRAAPSPVDGFVAPGLVLSDPTLILDRGRLTVHGRWAGLPAAQAFRLSERDGALYLVANDTLDMPFVVDLPAMVDEATGARMRAAGPLAARMAMAVRTELQRTGHLAVIDASFPLPDPAGSQPPINIRLPTLRLYEAPPTPNAILGQVVAQTVGAAGRLLAGQPSEASDYHIDPGSGDPRIRLGEASDDGIVTELPPLFAAGVDLTSEGGMLHIEQADASSPSRLTVAVPAGTGDRAVRADFDDLLRRLAALPADTGLSGGAIALLRRRIAQRLPAGFRQLLYYHVGWDPAQGHLDLVGGMRLRLDLEQYQFVQPSESRARSGWVGAGTFHVPIASYLHRRSDGTTATLVGFGPYLSLLDRAGSSDIASAGAGGPVDIRGPEYRKAHYRMFHPQSPADGAGPERVTTFIGCDTLGELQAATTALLADGVPDPKLGSSFFFRGRTGVVPEIEVHLDGRPVFVSLGTTLRQLLEAGGGLAASGLAAGDPDRLFEIRPLRLVNGGQADTPRYRFVDLGPGWPGGSSGADPLDLPLLPGDRLRS